MIICLLPSWCLDPELHSCKTHPEKCVFTLTGSIQSGLPSFQPPPFFILANSTRNGTFPDQGVVATLRAIVGNDLKVISGPVELATKKQNSPKLGLGTLTEMVTIKEEIQEQPGLRFIVSPPGQQM